MTNTQLETVAYIVKEEHIVSISEKIVPNTFVVEAEEPYPGYHGLNIPNERKLAPADIYLITKKRYAAEQIAHITRKVREKCHVQLDAARAELFFFNETQPAIRLRGLSSYTQIEEIQKWYIDSGVAMAKKQKTNTTAVIKIQKMLWANEPEEGIYIDLDDTNATYFRIPKEISWQEFVDITQKIKRNLTTKDFDVALGGIFRKQGLIDIVRVYTDKNTSVETLKSLQEKYITEIKKIG